MELFEVPNLDGMDREDLLIAEKVFARLAAIAGWLGSARKLRARGDIEAAMAHEKCAEYQYKQLPEWARW